MDELLSQRRRQRDSLFLFGYTRKQSSHVATGGLSHHQAPNRINKPMYKRLTLLFIFASTMSFAQVPVIFDTDIAPDFDDVGAMALLHAFADKGEARILATISCNTFQTTVPTLSVLNDYFKRPDIPVGITKGDFPNKECNEKWA